MTQKKKVPTGKGTLSILGLAIILTEISITIPQHTKFYVILYSESVNLLWQALMNAVFNIRVP